MAPVSRQTKNQTQFGVAYRGTATPVAAAVIPTFTYPEPATQAQLGRTTVCGIAFSGSYSARVMQKCQIPEMRKQMWCEAAAAICRALNWPEKMQHRS